MADRYLAPPSDFTERGRSLWQEYQRIHDVSQLNGQVAAIDPDSGRVWIAADPMEVIDSMNADGVDTPVYMVRVGYDYLYVKGRR